MRPLGLNIFLLGVKRKFLNFYYNNNVDLYDVYNFSGNVRALTGKLIYRCRPIEIFRNVVFNGLQAMTIFNRQYCRLLISLY